MDMTELEKRITRLEDIEAIKQLKIRYSHICDDMHNAGEIDTVETYLPFLIANIGEVTTVHHGHMPEIELTSPTTATGTWAMEDELWWPEGGPIRYMHGYGHYHETYRKDDGTWRIASLTLTRLHRIFEFAPSDDA